MAEPDHDGALTDRLAQQARALVERLEGTTVQRLTIQAGDARIEIERAVGVVAPAAAPAPAADGGAEAAAQDGRNAVLAPLVGRFYRASQPGAAPFVEVGDVVDQGQTVCIVEAMKMMNEVAPAAPGRIAEILVENGEFVEFEQVLMYLEPVEGEG
jgi:acetyl-CoA carboxylase biotin carboxyl carrier protein